MTDAIRLTVIRYKCPHCRTTRAKKQAAEAHIARCWHNPEARGCKTCANFLPAGDGAQCFPGCDCVCGSYPESCDIDAAPDDALPLIGCSRWASTPTT